MNINKSSAAAYLSGDISPYEMSSKIKFIIALKTFCGRSFTEERLDMIEAHTDSTSMFFHESINLIKNDEQLANVLHEMKVPESACGIDTNDRKTLTRGGGMIKKLLTND